MRRALLVLTCLALAAALLSACGGEDKAPKRDDPAQRLLRQTFATPALPSQAPVSDVGLYPEADPLTPAHNPSRSCAL